MAIVLEVNTPEQTLQAVCELIFDQVQRYEGRGGTAAQLRENQAAASALSVMGRVLTSDVIIKSEANDLSANWQALAYQITAVERVCDTTKATLVAMREMLNQENKS